MTFSNKRNFPTVLFTTLLVIVLSFGTVTAQVGIGTTNPLAMLHIEASNADTPTVTDGFLMPRVNNLASDALEPTLGMMVFYNGALTGNMKHTLYYYDGTNWVNAIGEIANAANPVSLYDWDDTNKGVVYWIDAQNPSHYKIVAALEFDTEFGSTNTNSEHGGQCDNHLCTSGANGFEATKSWIDAHSSLDSSHYEEYAASAAYYYDGDSDLGSANIGWYLPTPGEMNFIARNATSINSALSSVTHTDINNVDMRYWVCQDSKVDKAVLVKIKAANQEYKPEEKDKDYDDNPVKARPVREIGG